VATPYVKSWLHAWISDVLVTFFLSFLSELSDTDNEKYTKLDPNGVYAANRM